MAKIEKRHGNGVMECIAITARKTIIAVIITILLKRFRAVWRSLFTECVHGRRQRGWGPWPSLDFQTWYKYNR